METGNRLRVVIMGLRCWKCHSQIPGGMVVPDPMTTREVSATLYRMRVLPICQDCIESNPTWVAFTNPEDKRIRYE